MKSLNVLAILMGEGFSVFYQDADDRVWTRIAGVVIGLSYVALVIAVSRRLTRPAALSAQGPSLNKQNHLAHEARDHVFSTAKRVKLAECLAFMREGDVLTVTKPDRLARSTAELLSIEADLSKRGIGLVVLSMGGERLDTRNPTSKLMLTILAGVATWEREIMLERQREGIAKAKAAGKYKGARSASTRRRSGN